METSVERRWWMTKRILRKTGSVMKNLFQYLWIPAIIGAGLFFVRPRVGLAEALSPIRLRAPPSDDV